MTNQEILKRFQFDLEVCRFKESIKEKSILNNHHNGSYAYSANTVTFGNSSFAYGSRTVVTYANGNMYISEVEDRPTREILFSIPPYNKKLYLKLIKILEELDFVNEINLNHDKYFVKDNKNRNYSTVVFLCINKDEKTFHTWVNLCGPTGKFEGNSINEIPEYISEYKYTLFDCIKDVLKWLMKKF